jgi:hypothetical protein
MVEKHTAMIKVKAERCGGNAISTRALKPVLVYLAPTAELQ